MNEQKKQAIVDKLTFIIITMPDVSAFIAAPPPKIDQSVKDGTIFLVGDGYAAFDELCYMFQREKGWGEKFSREYLEEEVIFPLLNSALIGSNRDQLHHDLEAIVSKCDSYAEEHTAYIPIVGIYMKVDQLALGKITMRNMQGAQFRTFVEQVESAIVRHESAQEKRENWLEYWRNSIQPLLKGKTVATFSTVAEPLRAQELAEQECARIFDILHYFIFVSQKKRSINIGLPGELRHGLSEVVVASSTYELSTRSEVKGSGWFTITEQTLHEMQEAGIYDLIDMLRAEKKTHFSDTLLTGIHWLANALMQAEPANEFLSLVSCLETFLTRDIGDMGSISNAIAVGVAWVLGQNFAERQILRKEMKKLYDKRSSITHTGEQDDLADDLLLLRERVKAFLQAMVQRRDEFKTGGKKSLQLWIDEGPLRPVPSKHE